jgi:hypothetical protein
MTVAAFTQEEVLRSILRLRDPRLITLKVLYGIPGYADASIETKNYIYDMVSAKVKSLME